MESNNGEQRLKTPLQLEAIKKETRAFTCPNCNQNLQFQVIVKVANVHAPLTAEEVAARDGRPLTPKKVKDVPLANLPMGNRRPALVRLAQYYRDIGILGAFEEVAKELLAHQLPKDMDSFFLTWLRTSTKASLIPKLSLRMLINEFNDQHIEVFSSQQIGGIVSDGKLRCFIPMHLLRGEVVRLGGGSNTKLRTKATEDRLERWIRTKHGYVYGEGLMFGEMQKQARGQFELTVKN